MRVAITGARGRLGRVMRKSLEARGDEVVALSRNADAEHLALGEMQALIEKGNLDAIVHAAWSTVPSTAERAPGMEWREDLPLLASILGMLSRCAQSGERVPRLIFLSTCAVYGEPAEGGLPFDETSPVNPRGWYASGKTAAEGLIKRFDALPTLVLRTTNPYGYTQADQCMQGVLPVMVRAAKAGHTFRLWGSGEAIKDYLDVSDFSSAVEAVLAGGQTGVFNVASGKSVALNEVIRLVENATGRTLRIERHPAAGWDVQHGRYSHAALTAATGWVPKVSFEAGVRNFAQDSAHPHCT